MRNYGDWVRVQLNIIDRSPEWLYRRTKIGTGAVNRWCKGDQPRLDIFIKVCLVLGKAQNRRLNGMIRDCIEYIDHGYP